MDCECCPKPVEIELSKTVSDLSPPTVIELEKVEIPNKDPIVIEINHEKPVTSESTIELLHDAPTCNLPKCDCEFKCACSET